MHSYESDWVDENIIIKTLQYNNSCCPMTKCKDYIQNCFSLKAN